MSDLSIELAHHHRGEAHRVRPLANQSVLPGIRALQRGPAIPGFGGGLGRSGRVTGVVTSRAAAMSNNLIPLEQLASEANAWLYRAKIAEDRSRDLWISAGEILAEAKDRVGAGEPS